jgi:hypothetical protein
MLSLRAHVWICVLLFLAVFGGAIAGNILAASGIIPPAGAGLVVKIVFLTLFFAFGFSCIPVMAKLVLGSHRKDGEAAKGLAVAETIVTWGLWALIAAGLAIGLPFAIHDGFLD